MATRVRALACAVQEGSASSSTPRGSAPPEAPSLDECKAGLSTPAGCPPLLDQPSESEGSEEAGQQDQQDAYALTPGKTMRYARAGAVEFKIVTRKCFVGGFLQKPTILGTASFDDTDMIKVGGREEWLCQAATGKTERRGCFERGVARVREQLAQAIAVAASATQAKKLKVAASGREALGLVDESDSSGSSDEAKTHKIPKVDNLIPGQVQDILFGGAKFKAVREKNDCTLRLCQT